VIEPVDNVTQLLARWRGGDQHALESLLPMVYADLRNIARRHLYCERPDHTLQSTDLLHEAFLRLMKQKGVTFENRAHFFAIGARLMRQILVDHARNRLAAKRYGGERLELDAVVLGKAATSVDLLSLDDALEQLGHLDPQQARIIEMRFFGGLSIEETADVLGISSSTVKRDWLMARVWLHRKLGGAADHDA
jgi:RNA polymerase sigma factor (TIGR02999 family)